MTDSTFENLRFDTELPHRYYADCAFVRCCFSSALLAGTTFENCRFDTCDLSLARLSGGVFHNARFLGCKMTGTDFTSCSPFSTFAFEHCLMSYANFQEVKLSKTRFNECELVEADFSGARLQEALFNNCRLQRAVFHSSDLTAADLSTSHGVVIDPRSNKLKNTCFSRANLEGLVAHLGIRLVD